MGSIRWRLTIWYAVILAVVLTLYAGGAYAFLVHRLDAEMNRTLRMDFEEAEEFARRGSGEKHHDDHGFRRWMEVRKIDGTLMQRYGPADPLPATDAGIQSGRLPGGEHVRILSARYEIEGSPVVIRVARSEAQLRHELDEFLLVLGIALPLAVALLCAGGYFLARRTLAPVDRIAEQARTITADRLTKRLPVENPGDELGRLATAFNETFARLQQSFEDMKRFTGDAAHELRTPLTVLRSVGEVCLRDAASDGREAVASMLEEVERMTRLVDGLLALARADGTRRDRTLEPLDLGAFARELVDRLGIAARFEAADGIMVRADRDLLDQALSNVLDNAARHSPDDVTVRVLAPGTIEISDEGEGIAPEHIEAIFERFYRVDEARARNTGGAGLGLAIARWAVEAQGGTIAAESTPGAGATFQITLHPISA